jgi:hypothetical protein
MNALHSAWQIHSCCGYATADGVDKDCPALHAVITPWPVQTNTCIVSILMNVVLLLFAGDGAHPVSCGTAACLLAIRVQ